MRVGNGEVVKKGIGTDMGGHLGKNIRHNLFRLALWQKPGKAIGKDLEAIIVVPHRFPGRLIAVRPSLQADVFPRLNLSISSGMAWAAAQSRSNSPAPFHIIQNNSNFAPTQATC